MKIRKVKIFEPTTKSDLEEQINKFCEQLKRSPQHNLDSIVIKPLILRGKGATKVMWFAFIMYDEFTEVRP